MSKIGYPYRLVCKDVSVTECYVGSTINFRTRKCNHKKTCNKDTYQNHNLFVYQFIREHGGWDNWDMIQIEEFEHNTTRELHTRERYWIEHYKSELNRVIPTRTRKEWCEDNKEIISEQHKEYRQKNKEIISEQHKEYRQKNKEKISEKNKEYRQKNKEKIKEKNKEKITCECGSIHRKSDKTAHIKSKKHIKYIESQ